MTNSNVTPGKALFYLGNGTAAVCDLLRLPVMVPLNHYRVLRRNGSSPWGAALWTGAGEAWKVGLFGACGTLAAPFMEAMYGAGAPAQLRLVWSATAVGLGGKVLCDTICSIGEKDVYPLYGRRLRRLGEDTTLKAPSV